MITSRPLLLVLACIAMLVMRLDGVHQHLCFDGSEAPGALHFVDAGLHHVETKHGVSIDDRFHLHDVEVSATNDDGTQLPSLDLPVLALLTAVSFLCYPSVVACAEAEAPLAGPPIQLAQAIAQALEKNPDLAAFGYEFRAQDGAARRPRWCRIRS